MSKIVTVVAARWKALMPLVAYGVSELLKHGFDVSSLNTLTGVKAAVLAIVTAILVHTVPNKPVQP